VNTEHWIAIVSFVLLSVWIFVWPADKQEPPPAGKSREKHSAGAKEDLRGHC
jgi:hypothetical protein